MRTRSTSILFGFALFASGCSSRQAKPATAEDAAVTDTSEAGDAAPKRRSAPNVGNPSGPPIVNFPSFEVHNDGRSVITLQVRGQVQVTEQKAEGRIVYALGGVNVPEKVNRLPLETRNFPTQVSAVTVEQTAAGANLIIDLREPATPTYKITQNEEGSLLSVSIPRSEKYGVKDPATDPDNFERPRDAKDGDTVDGEDKSMDTVGEGEAEAESKETKRRRKRSRRQPKPYVERSLTLPYKTLAPDIAVSGIGDTSGNPAVFLTSGLRWGIIDEVELEFTPHSFRLSPDASYIYPSLGITAGYTGHVFEIAGRARLFLPIDTNLGLVNAFGALQLGAPMAIHLSTWGRIDTGAFVYMDFDGRGVAPSDLTVTGDVRAGLVQRQASPLVIDPGIPFNFLFQPVSELWFGIHSGISIFDFSDVANTFALPLGAEIGITASNDFNPVADLGVRADLPQFFLFGRDGDIVEEKAYQLGLWFRWFHHL